MRPDALQSELLRIAEEASAARQRLGQLAREAQELRERLLATTRGTAPPDEEATPRKLQSVQ